MKKHEKTKHYFHPWLDEMNASKTKMSGNLLNPEFNSWFCLQNTFNLGKPTIYIYLPPFMAGKSPVKTHSNATLLELNGWFSPKPCFFIGASGGCHRAQCLWCVTKGWLWGGFGQRWFWALPPGTEISVVKVRISHGPRLSSDLVLDPQTEGCWVHAIPRMSCQNPFGPVGFSITLCAKGLQVPTFMPQVSGQEKGVMLSLFDPWSDDTWENYPRTSSMETPGLDHELSKLTWQIFAILGSHQKNTGDF